MKQTTASAAIIAAPAITEEQSRRWARDIQAGLCTFGLYSSVEDDLPGPPLGEPSRRLEPMVHVRAAEVAQLAATLAGPNAEAQDFLPKAIGLICSAARTIQSVNLAVEAAMSEQTCTFGEALRLTGLKERTFRKHYKDAQEKDSTLPDLSDAEAFPPKIPRAVVRAIRGEVRQARTAKGKKGKRNMRKAVDLANRKYAAV